ncbi:MAG: hypothetical protein U0892_21045 [Pirellulales bacterium]
MDESSSIIRIATLQEYEKDLASFRDEQTRVFTLLYPNRTLSRGVIQHVFGHRVQLRRADGDARTSSI